MHPTRCQAGSQAVIRKAGTVVRAGKGSLMVQIRDEAGEPAVASQGEDLEVRMARELLERAKSEGVPLVGPGGLLAGRPPADRSRRTGPDLEVM
jgi:hypothetical protein